MLAEIKYHVQLEKLLRILAASLPGLVAANYCKNTIFLLAAFFSVLQYNATWSSLLPFKRRLLTHLFNLISAIVASQLIDNWLLFSIWLIIYALLFAIIEEASNHKWKSAFNWLFIGIIYGGFKLHSEQISLNATLIIMFLSLLGLLFGCLGHNIKGKVKSQLYFSIEQLFRYFKYVLPISISILIWHGFQLQQGQWLIWSSLSVVNLDLIRSTAKFKHRFSSVTNWISARMHG